MASSMNLACTVLYVAANALSGVVVACSCGPKPSVAEAFVRSDVIFSGSVISLDTMTIESREKKYTQKMLRYGILVERRFKGEGTDTLFVITGESPSECGLRLEYGKYYILYTSKFDVALVGSGIYRSENTTSRCTRTRPFDEEEVKALEEL